MNERPNSRTFEFLQHHRDNIKSVIGFSFADVLYGTYFDDVIRFSVFATGMLCK